jgi:hypothetical protein
MPILGDRKTYLKAKRFYEKELEKEKKERKRKITGSLPSFSNTKKKIKKFGIKWM